MQLNDAKLVAYNDLRDGDVIRCAEVRGIVIDRNWLAAETRILWETGREDTLEDYVPLDERFPDTMWCKIGQLDSEELHELVQRIKVRQVEAYTAVRRTECSRVLDVLPATGLEARTRSIDLHDRSNDKCPRSMTTA